MRLGRSPLRVATLALLALLPGRGAAPPAEKSSASQPFWEKTAGPTGEPLRSVTILGRGSLLVGTEAGPGMRPEDGGETWTSLPVPTLGAALGLEGGLAVAHSATEGLKRLSGKYAICTRPYRRLLPSFVSYSQYPQPSRQPI